MRVGALSLGTIGVLACGSPDAEATTEQATSASTAMSTPTTGEGDASTSTPTTGGGDTEGPGEGACAAELLAEPAAEVTYYVAIGEPGASNEACDGLAPSDEGGGRCPFKDLSAPMVLGLLDGVKSTRMALRAGTYVVSGWDGLRVTGIGASEAERVVLSAYAGEPVVLDVATPDGATCMADDAPDRPECVREVVRVSGQWTAVQGLTIRNGLGYNLEVTGGAHHLVRCNHFTETVDFPLRSDSLKLDGGASDIAVNSNVFTRWRSQAIDVTGVSEVWIEGNEFSEPHDADGGAIGCKFGTRDVTIRGNTIHDLGEDPEMKVFSLGGTGSSHPDDAEAYRIRVEGNHITGVAGKLAQFVGCQECAFIGNDAVEVGAGVLLSAAATGLPECEGGVAGCLANAGTEIRGNRMRGLHGGGDPASADFFVVVDAGEATGLVAGDNVYCAGVADGHKFGWNGGILGFAAWVEMAATDATSQAPVAGDAACAGW